MMKGIRLALKEAHKSTFKIQMGAVILRGGSVVSKGFNEIRYHSLSSGYNWPTTMHAEASALHKLKKKGKNAAGLTMYVGRINRKGQQLLASPCECCVNTAKLFGIKKIVFTLSQEPWYDEITL